jgi:enamine deaminase RidA (YjgF/YER057c/UK114 family)
MSHGAVSGDGAAAAPADAIFAVEPIPPRWVHEALGSSATLADRGGDVHSVSCGELLLLTAAIERATGLPVDALRGQVANVYLRLAAELAVSAHRPIRFWNFIPALGESMAPGLDRYMVFNAGRYDALATTDAGREWSSRMLPTASAVGVSGANLVVHCLASTTGATPIDNPRQISPWRYSARYGPRPPWFSRATVASINGVRRLLIGGTASIVGEDTKHVRDAAAQLDETLHNLSALLAAARNGSEAGNPLDRLVDVRAYVTADHHADFVARELTRRCHARARIELVRAQLCRPELLLEIEAVSEI